MTNKAVLVVGAADGVGRACAVDLARAGADVGVASLTLDSGEMVRVHSAANEIWSLGRRNLAIELDAGDAAAVADAVVRVRGEFGRLDAAVVAMDAGVVGTLGEGVAEALRGAGVGLVFLLDAGDEGAVAGIVEEIAARADGAG